MPPPEYDHLPSIQVIEQVMTSDRVNAQCHTLPGLKANLTYTGCISGRLLDGKVVCYVWRIDDASVARHERAHCNGWRHE